MQGQKFSTVNYRVFWFHVAWVVEIDYGDGEPIMLNEESVEAAIKTVREQRWKYRSEAEFKNALRIYEGALHFMRKEIERQMTVEVAARC